MTKMVFEVHANQFAPVAMKEIQSLRDKITVLEAQIVRDFKESVRFKAALDCAGSDLGVYDSGKSWPAVKLEGGKIVVTVAVKILDGETKASAPVAKPYSNLPEKTLNLLLNSKLVSDVEKRRIISAMTGGILDLPKAAEPVEVAK